jgi:hypothetical protein
MKKIILANKLRCKTGLYSLLLDNLSSLERSKEVIPFPDVFSSICVKYSINKCQAWEILFLLNDLGFIKIIAGHGVQVKNKGHC